MDKISK
jgi:hypothetical protein